MTRTTPRSTRTDLGDGTALEGFTGLGNNRYAAIPAIREIKMTDMFGAAQYEARPR